MAAELEVQRRKKLVFIFGVAARAESVEQGGCTWSATAGVRRKCFPDGSRAHCPIL
jgi:hypothetical protein